MVGSFSGMSWVSLGCAIFLRCINCVDPLTISDGSMSSDWALTYLGNRREPYPEGIDIGIHPPISGEIPEPFSPSYIIPGEGEVSTGLSYTIDGILALGV